MSLGLRAAAKELGISHVALLKAANAGRVTRLPDGSFDVDACREDLAKKTHPGKSANARCQQRKRPVAGVVTVTGDSDTTISEAARQLEWEKVRERRWKNEVEEGRLVELATVNSFVAGMIIKARDEFTRIGPEMRDRLAQESDPVVCERIVDDRIRQALEKMSEYRAA